MNLQDVRLVAVDMDGTLLNSKGELSPDFFPIFNQLTQKGIQFAAASGRQYYNLLNRFESIKDNMIFIAENGGYMAYRGKELLVQAMDKEVVVGLLQTMRDIPQTSVVLCGAKSAYIHDTEPEFVEHVRLYYDRCEIVDNLENVTGDQFLKIAIYDFAGSENNSYRYFSHLQNQLQVKISGTYWLDISHKDASKGTAIEQLQQHLGIGYSQTMVFGDYLNDLEMMQQGYFSYAMANAHDGIKEVSRFTTKSNDEDGVALVLRQLL
ncbi:HAD family hydrolase [Foetidibacter luteolus]|uniref:HAD family hydrolase n=1 Tax=Foetidibacter luteolus TaxID=2608880 RepID=UPI00129BD2C6|nr:HAD family hydrolase [Foetidibacter luteolus]